MVGRVILLILLLLILLVFFVPYGVDAGYEEGVLSVRIKAGPLRFTLYPKKPPTARQLARKQKKKEKAEAKKKAAQAKKDKEKAEGGPKGTNETITVKKKREIDLNYILALVRMGVRAIRRFFRSFTVDYLKVHCIVAGPDPYDTAVLYGRLGAAAEELPALCGGVIRVRERDVAFSADFTADWPWAEARIVLSLQLYKLVHLAAAFLAEYIGWTIKDRRQKKAAASMERKDDNGRQQDQ